MLLALLALLASGLPLVAGLATPAVRQPASSSVLVSLFVDKATKASSVILTDKTKTKIYGHSCTSTLALGSLNVAYNVDQYGIGKLDLGPKTYTVHSDATVSGGVECGVIYDDTELHVDCLAPWTADFQLVELPVNATLPCFENHVSRRSAYGMDEEVYEPFVSGEVEARQAGSIGSITCNPIARTRLVGNGDPHQNYRHTQLSENLSCGKAAQCTVGYQQSKSFTIGWTASAGIAWIAGGFAVEQSWQTGNSYECTGSTGQTVCIKYKTALTAYTVNGGYYTPCTGSTSWNSGNAIIWSPNRNNKGGGYYCVIKGATTNCVSQGNSWLVKEGRAGGP